jgi:hypothetical protein
MERKWTITILFLVLTIALLFFIQYYGNTPAVESRNPSISLNQYGDVAGLISYQIDMKSSIPANPGKILVYKPNPPTVNKEITLALAKKFNVIGNMVGDQGVQSQDLRFTIWISKTAGTIEYDDSNRPNDAMDAPDKLPSDEDAVKIATKFLKEKDLLPEGAEPGKVKREYTVFTDNDGKVIPRNGEVTVGFGRKLNNLVIKGAGGSVTLGGNGDIIRYSADWRNYTPFKEYPLKSPDTAFTELKNKGIATGVKKPDSVSIDNVSLTYLSKAPAFEEYYLEPVWVFKGQAVDKDSKVNPVTEYIPALTDEAVKSLNP